MDTRNQGIQKGKELLLLRAAATHTTSNKRGIDDSHGYPLRLDFFRGTDLFSRIF